MSYYNFGCQIAASTFYKQAANTPAGYPPREWLDEQQWSIDENSPRLESGLPAPFGAPAWLQRFLPGGKALAHAGVQAVPRATGAVAQQIGPGGMRAAPTLLQRLGVLGRQTTLGQAAGIGAGAGAGVGGGAYALSQLGGAEPSRSTMQDSFKQPEWFNQVMAAGQAPNHIPASAPTTPPWAPAGTPDYYANELKNINLQTPSTRAPNLSTTGLATDYSRLKQIAGAGNEINSTWEKYEPRRLEQHRSYRAMQENMDDATRNRFNQFMKTRAQQARAGATQGDPSAYMAGMQRARAQAMRDWRRGNLTQQAPAPGIASLPAGNPFAS